MAEETIRTIVFVDGQNLYHCLREAFSVTHPNYDLMKLSRALCEKSGSQFLLKQVRFYTGYPSISDDAFWGLFWQKKLLSISRQGIHKYARQLKYRQKTIKLSDGSEHKYTVAEEKGIDVRIAIDILKLALDNQYDCAMILSQDQDLSEAVDEVKKIARARGSKIFVKCAYPLGSGTINKRGINNTDWLQFDKALYEHCIDPTDYRK